MEARVDEILREGRRAVMKFDKVTPPSAAVIFFVLAWKRTIRLVDISEGVDWWVNGWGREDERRTQGRKRFPTFPLFISSRCACRRRTHNTCLHIACIAPCAKRQPSPRPRLIRSRPKSFLRGWQEARKRRRRRRNLDPYFVDSKFEGYRERSWRRASKGEEGWRRWARRRRGRKGKRVERMKRTRIGREEEYTIYNSHIQTSRDI